MIEATGGQQQYPLYEGEEEPSSDDEPYLNEDDVVIRRKKKYIRWPGLERGIPQSFNTAEDGDQALWDKYGFPRQVSLGAESSLSQLDAYIETFRQMKPTPVQEASINKKIILYALTNIKLTDEFVQYREYQQNTLTLNMTAEKEDYGLTIPSGKEKVDPLDLKRSKRQYADIRRQLVDEFRKRGETCETENIVEKIATSAIPTRRQVGDPIHTVQVEQMSISEPPEIETGSQKTLKSFMQESPEAAIQQIEVENKIATAELLDTSAMGSDDEILCCFAIDAIITELSTEYKPGQLDMSQNRAQQEIYQMLNVIMSEDAEIRAENVSSYHKRADDEPVNEHFVHPMVR